MWVMPMHVVYVHVVTPLVCCRCSHVDGVEFIDMGACINAALYPNKACRCGAPSALALSLDVQLFVVAVCRHSLPVHARELLVSMPSLLEVHISNQKFTLAFATRSTDSRTELVCRCRVGDPGALANGWYHCDAHAGGSVQVLCEDSRLAQLLAADYFIYEPAPFT